MADTVLSELAAVVQTDGRYMAYTTDELLVEALGMMGESAADKQDFSDGLLTKANELIAELYNANNMIRQTNGKEPFTEYPVMMRETDVVPLEYETIRNGFVYGLAYWLLMLDDEYVKANAMLAQYNTFLARGRAAYRPVRSVV
jgi:hypothetical protein